MTAILPSVPGPEDQGPQDQGDQGLRRVPRKPLFQVAVTCLVQMRVAVNDTTPAGAVPFAVQRPIAFRGRSAYRTGVSSQYLGVGRALCLCTLATDCQIRRPAAGSGDPAGARCDFCPYFLRRYSVGVSGPF